MNKNSGFREIILGVDYLNLQQSDEEWWTRAQLERLLGVFKEAGLWLGFEYYNVADREVEGWVWNRMDARGDWLDEVSAFNCLGFQVACRPDDRSTSLKIVHRHRAVGVSLMIEEDDPFHQTEGLLDRLVGALVSLHEAFGPTAHFGPDIDVTFPQLAYPERRPPCWPEQWGSGQIVHAHSRAFFADDPRVELEELETLVRSPLPEGATCTDLGDLVIFRWMDDLKGRDNAEIAQAKARRMVWIDNILKFPIDPSYNKLGDYAPYPILGGPHAPLTYLNSYGGGFKAIVVGPKGKVDEALWEEMVQWVKDGQLPDGKAIETLSLITQNRRGAIAIHDRAKAAGFIKAFYIDNDGVLWDPFPGGWWLEEGE